MIIWYSLYMIIGYWTAIMDGKLCPRRATLYFHLQISRESACFTNELSPTFSSALDMYVDNWILKPLNW